MISYDERLGSSTAGTSDRSLRWPTGLLSSPEPTSGALVRRCVPPEPAIDMPAVGALRVLQCLVWSVPLTLWGTLSGDFCPGTLRRGEAGGPGCTSSHPVSMKPPVSEKGHQLSTPYLLFHCRCFHCRSLPFLVSFTALQCFSLPFLVVSPPSLGHAGGGPPARAR